MDVKPVFSYLIRRFLIGLITVYTLLICTTVAAQTDDNRLLWLRWLGVTTATQQTDRIIEQELKQLLLQQAIADESLQLLRHQLLTHSGSDVITTDVISFVLENFSKSNGLLAQILNNPLAVRVRNFDVALEMVGAFKKLSTFNHKYSQDPPSDKRLALMKQLDKAQRTSKIAALIQTELNITAKKLAEKISGNKWKARDPQWLIIQKQQREHYMSEIVIKLHLFCYRFMKDNELQDYIQLIEDKNIQSMLDVAVQGIQESLKKARINALKKA